MQALSKIIGELFLAVAAVVKSAAAAAVMSVTAGLNHIDVLRYK